MPAERKSTDRVPRAGASRASEEGADTDAAGTQTPRGRGWRVRLGVSASWFSVLTVVITAAVVHIPWERTARNNVRDVIEQLNAQIVTSVQREVDAMLAEAEAVQATIRGLGENGSIDFDDPQDVLNSYLPFLRAHPYFSWVSYGMPNGDFYGVQRRGDDTFNQVVSQWREADERARRTIAEFARQDGRLTAQGTRIETNAYHAPDRAWYRKAGQKQGDMIWTDVYVFATSGKPGLNTAVTRGIGNDGISYDGVISIAIELQRISDYLQSRAATEGGDIVLFDASGRLLAASDPELLRQQGTDAHGRLSLPKIQDSWHPVLQTLADATAERERGSGAADDARLIKVPTPAGEQAFVNVKPLGFQDWRVATVVPEHVVTGDIEAHRLRLLGLLAVAVLAISGIALWISRQILIKPLVRLTHQTGRVAQLDMSEVQGVSSHIREIDALSRSLKRTASSLQAFGKYLPTELLRALHAQGVRPEIGGERRTLTVFFMDVVGFTHATERMGHRIVPVLSEYVEAVSSEIADAGGTIDKYIGDAVMAFWGAPAPDEEHATAACRAALNCQARIDRLNAAHDGDPMWPEIKVRIGINTGRVVVGNMGSRQLLDYTVIGDPVNLASRLEEMAKDYGVKVIIGQASYEHAKYDIVARHLDFVSVKGRDERVAVYEVLDMADQARGWPDGYEWVEHYENGLGLLFNRERDAAIAAFEQVIAERGEDPPARIMIERAQRVRRTVPLLPDGRDAADGSPPQT